MNVGYIFNQANGVTGVESVSIATVDKLIDIDANDNFIILRGNKFNSKIQDNVLPRIFVESSYNNIDLSIKMNDINIVHSFFPPIDDIKIDMAKVLTVHDVIPLKHPEWFFPDMVDFFKTRMKKSIDCADRILAVSKTTKDDIINFYGIEEKKIEVVYNGLISSISYNGVNQSTREKFKISDDYILSVCTLEPRKNLVGLIKAFLDYKHKTKNEYKLVLAGKVGHDKNLFPFLEAIGDWQKDIVITGYVTDQELGELYHNAIAIAYVSFYEGFGLPILEGMAAGKAVISSNTSSMPEVGGDAVCYCDPYNTESIIWAIEKVCDNREYREELEKKALIQARKFDYTITAKKILDIYREVL